MSSKKNNSWATLADLSPYKHKVRERILSPTKNTNINTFVVKSLLEYICKHFRKSAIRENFALNPETKLKKTQSKNEGKCTHQYNEVKEKL